MLWSICIITIVLARVLPEWYEAKRFRKTMEDRSLGWTFLWMAGAAVLGVIVGVILLALTEEMRAHAPLVMAIFVLGHPIAALMGCWEAVCRNARYRRDLRIEENLREFMKGLEENHGFGFWGQSSGTTGA